MSRNLGRRDFYFCGGPVEHEEPPRPITRAEVGGYFSEYEGMLVANAHCAWCVAKYLAWVHGRSDWTIGHLAPRNRREDDLHVDLSFRASFNDEPARDDLPEYEVVKTISRVVDGAHVKLVEERIDRGDFWRKALA